jgi:hypothetical protein
VCGAISSDQFVCIQRYENDYVGFDFILEKWIWILKVVSAFAPIGRAIRVRRPICFYNIPGKEGLQLVDYMLFIEIITINAR